MRWRLMIKSPVRLYMYIITHIHSDECTYTHLITHTVYPRECMHTYIITDIYLYIRVRAYIITYIHTCVFVETCISTHSHPIEVANTNIPPRVSIRRRTYIRVRVCTCGRIHLLIHSRSAARQNAHPLFLVEQRATDINMDSTYPQYHFPRK